MQNIHSVERNSPSRNVFYSIKLKDVCIRSVAMAGSIHQEPMAPGERIELDYGSISWDYVIYDGLANLR